MSRIKRLGALSLAVAAGLSLAATPATASACGHEATCNTVEFVKGELGLG